MNDNVKQRLAEASLPSTKPDREDAAELDAKRRQTLTETLPPASREDPGTHRVERTRLEADQTWAKP